MSLNDYIKLTPDSMYQFGQNLQNWMRETYRSPNYQFYVQPQHRDTVVLIDVKVESDWPCAPTAIQSFASTSIRISISADTLFTSMRDAEMQIREEIKQYNAAWQEADDELE